MKNRADKEAATRKSAEYEAKYAASGDLTKIAGHAVIIYKQQVESEIDRDRKFRCYKEHLTSEEKEDCIKTKHVHMGYDQEADYGYFE